MLCNSFIRNTLDGSLSSESFTSLVILTFSSHNLISKILAAAVDLLVNLSLADSSDSISSPIPFTPHSYTITSPSMPAFLKDLKTCPPEESLSSPNQTSLKSDFEQFSLLSELCFGIDTYYGP